MASLVATAALLIAYPDYTIAPKVAKAASPRTFPVLSRKTFPVFFNSLNLSFAA